MRTVQVALVVAAAAAGAACVPGWVEENESPVILRIVDINGGAPVDSDVRLEGTTVVDDLVNVTLAVRPKNQNGGLVIPQIPMAVFLEQYQVRFFRTDGHNVEGVDVPYRFTGGLNGVIDVADSGDTLTVAIPLVRAQAKLDPPLTNLRGVFPGALGGSELITSVIAEVTVYGRTVPGETVHDSARVMVNFADFPE